MKTSLAQALKNPDHASSFSLSSSYKVPATDGRMVVATPLKFCMNFRPPTIAVVYTLEKSKKSTSKSGKPRKYIHEIRVDFESCIDKSEKSASAPQASMKPTKGDVETLCRKLLDQEPIYLNLNFISKTQVLSLITKLYEKKYGCQPPESPKQVASGAAPGAPSNLFSKPPKDDDSDEYDDDFDDVPHIGSDNAKAVDSASDLMANNKPAAAGSGGNQADQKQLSAAAKVEDDDDWGMEDDDWGDLEDDDDKRQREKNSVKKPSLLGMHDVAGLEDKNESSADKKKQKNNLFLGGIGKDELGDEFDDDDIDNFLGNGNEDKFNQVLSKTKEGGGLLASIGLNKNDVKDGQSLDDSELNESQHQDLHKKSDLFDTSKDRKLHARGGLDAQGASEDDEDFDLGFASNSKKDDPEHKQSANENLEAFEAELAAAGISDDEGPMTAEQQNAISEQFQLIYEKDEELRKALEKSDVANFSVMEKYSIIEAYMQGGAAGLQIELEDDEEDDEKAIAEMTEEEMEAVESQFAKLYAADPELQNALGDINDLTLLQKYQILVQYQQAGEQSNNDGQYFSGDEMTEIIEHEGKQYRRVQIEGTDGDHLMDDDANIYTLDFVKIGCAGESDNDEDI